MAALIMITPSTVAALYDAIHSHFLWAPTIRRSAQRKRDSAQPH